MHIVAAAIFLCFSLAVGMVDESNVIGKVFIRLYPFNQIGTF